MTGLITTLPLEPAARERLSARLDARVMDIREPVETVGLVLTPPRSPQLIGALRLKYEAARVVIIDLTIGTSTSGPRGR